MFNPLYVQHVKKNIPLINPLIANGLSQEHAKSAMQHIDDIFKEMAKGFPSYITYDGIERATPEEEYSVTTKSKSSSRRYDLARTDSYFCKYKITVSGLPIVRYIALPIIGDANTLHINDTKYVYSPVIADKVISITANSVFIKLIRAKLTFYKHATYFTEDNKRELVQTIHSMAYNHRDKSQFAGSKVNMKTTLVHYLLCKHGLTNMFIKYLNVKPIVGKKSDFKAEDYPLDKWVICTTAAISRPNSLKVNYYRPTDLVIMIPRDKYNQSVKNYVAGIFYIADHFPEPDKITNETMDDPILWQAMLGETLWASDIHVGRLTEEVKRHMGSLEEYIDSLVKNKLEKSGIFIDDLFDLYALIIEKYLEWHLERAEDTNNLYDKELIVLEYLLEDPQHQIVKFYFKLIEASKDGRILTRKDVEDILNKEIKLNALFALKKPEHGEAFIAESAGDNKFFKMTQVITQQEKTNKIVSKRSEVVSNDDPTLKSHVSVAYVCNHSAVSKSDPTGRNRINPYVLLGDDKITDTSTIRGRYIVRNPELDPILDRTNEMIKTKF